MYRSVLAKSVALAGVLLLAGYLWADAAKDEAKKDGAHAGAEPKKFNLRRHGKEDMEIDPANPKHREAVLEALQKGEAEELVEKKTVSLMKLRVDLGLWTVVVFVLLYFILRKVAWGPMLEGLHKREEGILGALAEAEKARAEAKSLRAHFESEMAKVGDKVRELMDEARRDAQHMQDEMMAKGKAEIKVEQDRRLKEIELAKDQALKELWEQTAQLATLVSAKTIRRDLGVEDHRRLVDEALAEMDKTVSGTRQKAWGSNA